MAKKTRRISVVVAIELTSLYFYTDKKENDVGPARIRPEILDDVQVEDLVNEYLNSQANVSRFPNTCIG